MKQRVESTGPTKIYRKEIADKKAYEKIPINDELTTALCES